MDTALVTGAAGFIGSHLVDELLDRGYQVRGFDDFSFGKRSNLSDTIGHDRFELFEADLRDLESVQEASEGVDVVFHQGAVASVPLSIEEPEYITQVNCTGTSNVVQAAQNQGVNTVVAASSASVYGSEVEIPISEDSPVNPKSPYAASKLYTEQLVTNCSRQYDFKGIALRYFNVFGPRQDPEGDYAAVIPTFLNLMFNREQPIIYGDGKQTRDFVYVDDVIRGNLLAAERGGDGEVFNIGRGERISINELVTMLNDALGTDIEPRYEENRPGDIRHSGASIGKANENLSFTPEVPITEGLVRFLEYFE